MDSRVVDVVIGFVMGVVFTVYMTTPAHAYTLTVQHTSRVTGITKVHTEEVKSCTAINKIRAQSLGTIKAWCNGRRV